MQNFTPDKSAVLSPPWNTVELSQRDVSIQIPLDYVTLPAVSLTAACFGAGVYEVEAARRCISNLLTVGYRRLYVDVYWSQLGNAWRLCPVDNFATHSTQNDPIPSSTVTESNGRPAARSLQGKGAPQTPTSLYSCTNPPDISTLAALLEEYFRGTENTINANMIFLIINIHAAHSDASDKSPMAPSLNKLPSPDALLGKVLEKTLDTYIFDPAKLRESRQNLNESWLAVRPSQRPIEEYLTTTMDDRHHLITDNGWPPAGFVVLARATRLIMGWGTVDPQMASYNFAEDSNIFSSDSLTSRIDTEFDLDANLTAGCLYKPGSTDLFAIHRSWAMAEVPQLNSSLKFSTLARQLMSCGISPVVNHTLLNMTADKDIEPYRQLSFSSTWSWAKDEPLNMSSSTSQPRVPYRCAVMDGTLSGKWRACDCSFQFRVACRVGNSPLDWALSEDKANYLNAAQACPDNTTFSVPRTALENTYLYSKLNPLSNPTSSLLYDTKPNERDSKEMIWIDFNSIDVASCWVTNGPGAQCPYEVDDNAIQRRAILVPTIAAIIVLILTALTLFVKCNANRRNSRKRKFIDGWDYEGVPS